MVQQAPVSVLGQGLLKPIHLAFGRAFCGVGRQGGTTLLSVNHYDSKSQCPATYSVLRRASYHFAPPGHTTARDAMT